MTGKARLEASYHRLCVAYRAKPDKAEFLVYADSLADLPIEAIEAAERRLRREGTGPRQFFPSAPHWHHLALEEYRRQLRGLLATSHRRAFLQAAPEERASDLRRIAKARDTFIRQLRRLGFRDLARSFATLPSRHPADDQHAPFCADCDDIGMVVREREGREEAYHCACAASNPAVQLRRLEEWTHDEARIGLEPTGGASGLTTVSTASTNRSGAAGGVAR